MILLLKQIFSLFPIICLLSQVDFCIPQRRIVGGRETSANKPYVAYLIKSPKSQQPYDYWMCGGAIVSEWFIITSAACVEDIGYMYAVIGLGKAVTAAELDTNNCASKTKKKVVLTCVPKNYHLDYGKIEKWSFIDIAAIRVESKISFTVLGSGCDWIPQPIMYNDNDQDLDKAGQYVMLLGWGHDKTWRKEDDTTNMNQEKLHYASTKIISKKKCKNEYKDLKELYEVIDKYMICTAGEGRLDENGKINRNVTSPPDDALGCVPFCDPSDPAHVPINKTIRTGNYGYNYNLAPNNYYNFRRAPIKGPVGKQVGICQNDHGGPLVTYIGTTEILIGVHSVFLVDGRNNDCVGPFLHTSTYCNRGFLNCVVRTMHPEGEGNRRHQGLRSFDPRICDMPAEQRGFDMIKRRISWVHHPDGPAENELDEDLLERPQIPLKFFQRRSNADITETNETTTTDYTDSTTIKYTGSITNAESTTRYEDSTTTTAQVTILRNQSTTKLHNLSEIEAHNLSEIETRKLSKIGTT